MLIDKELDLLLIEDGVTRIVTAVTFSVGRSSWVLFAKPAKQEKYHMTTASTLQYRYSRRKGLATYSKDFNNNQNKPLIYLPNFIEDETENPDLKKNVSSFAS